ncbi:phage-related protein [Nitrobacter vulgaris]|uniref:hypothetical protein n=1 Tax=Nitrobacter vulgaris TaxID=29421 RepID=UPI0028559B10|nr:hypothetical protein [Nitrobacter vulgaris]MDR6303059.1 phage-related protein [Nitrobacter vulgaris]
MASKSFSVRISLDGGADIRKQLEGIGAAGRKAFSDLEDASRGNSFLQRFGVTVTEVVGKIGALQETFRTVGGAAVGFGSKVGGAVDRLAALGGLSIGGAVAGFISLTKAAGDAGEQLKNTADTIGITAQQLKNLKDAVELSGIDGGQFERGLLKLSSGMAEAGKSAITYDRNLRDLRQQYNDGEISSDAYWKAVKKLKQANEDSLDPFTRLGIVVKNADGSLRNTHDVLLDISDVFKGMPDGANKAGLAAELFGSKNSRMATFVGQGSRAIVEMEKEMQRLAPSLDDASGAALDKAADSFGQLHKTLGSVRNSILATFAPQVTKLVMGFVEAIVRGRTDLTLYASTIADKVKPIVEDLVALLEGRDSDVQNQSIIKAKASMIDFAAATKNAIVGIIIPAFNAFLTTLDITVKAINAVFGTDLTAGQIAIVGVILRLTGLFGVLTSGAQLAYVAVAALITTFGGIPVAIAAAGFAVGFLLTKLVTDWDGTTKKIGELWQALWSLLPQGAQDALSAVAAPFIAFGTVVARIVAGVAMAFESLFNGEFVANLGTIFSALWEMIKSGAADAWESVKSTALGAWDAIKQGVTDAADWIVQKFNSAVDTVKGYFSGLVDIISGVLAKARSAADTIASAVGGGGGDKTPGFAGGGHIRGAGTGTSDSIIARVSNGEYIFTAKAVKRLGLPILNALNYGFRDIGSVFRGFNVGGLVDALTPSVPRFASGGLVSVPATSGGDLRPANIHLRDGSFPVMAQQSVIDSLTRYATGKEARSAGRKPTWYRS